MAGEKTEKATTKRRKEQRKEGNIVLSQDIVGAAVLFGIFGMLKAMGQQYVTYMANGMKTLLGGIGQNLAGLSDLKQKFGLVVIISIEVLAPIFIVNLAISIIATMAQTKLLISPKAAKFKLSKINPISGFKNMFSAKAIGETVKSVIKTIIIGYIMFSEIQANLPQLFTLSNEDVGTSAAWIAQFILDVCFKACAAFLIIGIVDYFYQWWDYERRMKMSKQELKEEYKETEGNPETKGRIRGQQRKMSQQRQIQAVPSADVVIRNPTHYAIALKYDREKAHAPVVVAKGQNNVALKIVEVAMASRVHIIENVPLAQALYKTVEVGQEIPEEFYKAVAEVLAYIYKLKRAGRG